MPLGMRPQTPFPASYKGFHLIRTHGRVFGAPSYVEADVALQTGKLLTHPAAFSAATREEIEALIDSLEGEPQPPEPIGDHGGHDLFGYRGQVYAVPAGAGAVDLDLAEERRRAGVLMAATREEVVALVEQASAAVPVEFAGWLPVFERSGNCGAHPQFAHAGDAPPGYVFVRSAPPEVKLPLWRRAINRACRIYGQVLGQVSAALQPLFAVFRSVPGVGLRERARTLSSLVRVAVQLYRRGAPVGPLVRFLLSRHFQSQLLLSRARGLTFLTSMPYTFNQGPWVIEIEDPTTLFYPHIQNGNTCGLNVRESPFYPVVKALLESDECRGIVTHMRSTAALVPTLFGSEAIRRKVFYRPLGVKLPARWQRHRSGSDEEEVHLLFINSWCQVPENFYLRGGLDVLEAFAVLRERYPQVRLTLRTALPALANHYHRILESGWVRVINRFLSAEEMASLHAESQIFLLPAARVHIVSLLQAMSYGLAVVGSDGWGMEEYLEDERNGLVVRGRAERASWADEEAGVLREDYQTMYTADPEVVQGIVDAVSRLVEDRALRGRLGRQARADVEAKYNVAQWNEGLREVFDRATGRAGAHAG